MVVKLKVRVRKINPDWHQHVPEGVYYLELPMLNKKGQCFEKNDMVCDGYGFSSSGSGQLSIIDDDGKHYLVNANRLTFIAVILNDGTEIRCRTRSPRRSK